RVDGGRAQHRAAPGVDAAPVRHAGGRGHPNANAGRGEGVVARHRRGEPRLLPKRRRRFVVVGRPADEKPAAGAGGGAPCRGWRLKQDETVAIAIPTGVLTSGALQLLTKSGLTRLSAEELGRPMLRIATKYPRTTSAWFEARGQAVEVVRLHGSVELEPQVGLVDGIVDLTATGRTLRENRLRIAAELGASTARLIANQASLKTRTEAVQSVVSRLRKAAGLDR